MKLQIKLEEVNTSEQRKLFTETINKHHSYIKDVRTPNRRINWLVYKNGKLAGAIGINSCVMHLKPRDEFLGFKSKAGRLRRLNNYANNYRFCIMPKEAEQNFASQVLKQLRSVAPKAWKKKYGNKLSGIETFVGNGLPGSCYKADNWVFLGETKGWSLSKVPKTLSKDAKKKCIAKNGGKMLSYCFTGDKKKIFFYKF